MSGRQCILSELRCGLSPQTTQLLTAVLPPDTNVLSRRTQEVLGSSYKAARTAPLSMTTWDELCTKRSVFPLVLILSPKIADDRFCEYMEERTGRIACCVELTENANKTSQHNNPPHLAINKAEPHKKRLPEHLRQLSAREHG